MGSVILLVCVSRWYTPGPHALVLDNHFPAPNMDAVSTRSKFETRRGAVRRTWQEDALLLPLPHGSVAAGPRLPGGSDCAGFAPSQLLRLAPPAPRNFGYRYDFFNRQYDLLEPESTHRKPALKSISYNQIPPREIQPPHEHRL